MTDSPKYADVVSYATMDPFKVLAQLYAAGTDEAIADTQYRVADWSRGESAFLLEAPDHYLAHVEEGLGTLNRIPEEVARYLASLSPEQEQLFWHSIGQTNAAMIFNDMATLGARLLSGALHVAAGHGSWFEREARTRGLFAGWAEACKAAGGVWGGGESSTLRDVVMPGSAVLGGSAMGIVKPKSRVIHGNIQDDDLIILIHSSGVHSNGITLIRDLLPLVGLKATMPSGERFVDALLQPTPIYASAVRRLLEERVEIHYIANITGHGWRKIMRANTEQPFNYAIDILPPQLEVFEYIRKEAGISLYNMYGDYNQGAGYALIVKRSEAWRAETIIKRAGFECHIAGKVEAHDAKQVEIRPLDITFTADTLQVR